MIRQIFLDYMDIATRRAWNVEADHDTEAYIKYSGGKTYVYFSASDLVPFTDWIFNLWFTAAQFKGHKVHSGFLKKWLAIKPLIEGKIQGPAVFVGHSLGGAIAELAVMDLGGEAYTYGTPPVYYTKTPLRAGIIRVQNANDPVCFWPQVVGLKHSTIMQCNHFVLNRHKARWWRLWRLWNPWNHTPVEYIAGM